MNIKEIKGDLLLVDDSIYTIVHCIDSTCAMGEGKSIYPNCVAYKINKKYKCKDELLSKHTPFQRKSPTAIKTGVVIHLITKSRHYLKPTYATVEGSLIKMREIVEQEGIKYIAMPILGSGLDQLAWSRVKEIVQTVFSQLEGEILVYHFKESC